MQEIIKGIYVENSYLGVTLGAINLDHGLILVDAPPRAEDSRSWRATLANLGGGVDRLLVNLDSHVDRTLGARAMECTIVAHEKTAQVFRNRPITFKAQSGATGAEWEQISGLGSVRWAPPELTFTERLSINWSGSPLILEHHPGPNPGAIWIDYPAARVLFVGDVIMHDQPPFLANADLAAWIESLQLLLSMTYQDYFLISGRGGVVIASDVKAQLFYIQEIKSQIEELAERKAPPEATEEIIPHLLSPLDYPAYYKEKYTQRLKWGLYHYYIRRNRSANQEMEE